MAHGRKPPTRIVVFEDSVGVRSCQLTFFSGPPFTKTHKQHEIFAKWVSKHRLPHNLLIGHSFQHVVFFWIPPNHPSHQIINVVNRFTVDPWWPGDPRKTRLPSPWACLAFLVAAFWTWTSTVWNFIKWPGRLLEDDDIEYSITNLSLSLYIYI